MQKRHVGVILFLGITLWACQKENVKENVEENLQLTADPAAKTNISSTTPRLSYGDTIFYLKNQPGDYTVQPVSRPASPGSFKANPIGLELDSITGQINVTQSETGLRYKIYYLDSTGKAIDSVKLVLSGIDYADGIYELQSTPAAYDTAFPIYNARPELPLPCPPDDDDDNEGDDDDQGCVFDETDLDNDGNDDIPGVIQDKLLVDIKQGTLDLEASFHAGIFGSSNPANGVTKDFTFYYRLNDFSNRALNKITVRIYHYKKRSDIPQWLLNELNNRNTLAQEVNMRSGGSQFSATALRYVDSKPKRPPLIIIVSQ